MISLFGDRYDPEFGYGREYFRLLGDVKTLDDLDEMCLVIEKSAKGGRRR
jgi:hypothetical protein